MKPSMPWLDTPFGRFARWLGSVQLAVPVLALVAISLGWGTYLESTRDAKVSRALVYGSWWFLALMILVCVSLIFAAVVRFPWKRRHIGFLIVHASLVSLIVGGFWSLFGRVEGHLGLQQGTSSGLIELSEEQVELVEHDAGQFRVLGEAPAPTRPGTIVIGGYPIEVTEVWSNVREEFDVLDDGPEAYRAVQVALGPSIASGIWIGDEARGPAPVFDGVRIRVLAAGSDWQPPAAPANPGSASRFAFVLNAKKFPLGTQGQEAIPGWNIVSVSRFMHASVGPAGLIEDPSKPRNPAVEVTISNGKGSSERHTAFEQFEDMILVKPMDGSDRSGARLVPTVPAGGGAAEETLVLYGDTPGLKLGYVGRDGVAVQLEHDGNLPWQVDLGSRHLTIVKQLTHAAEHSRFVKAPAAKDARPAIVVKNGPGPTPLAYKSAVPVNLPGRVAILRFGPRTVSLPFAIRLDQFRKIDYPGTDMAMSYESDVTVSLPSSGERKKTISMNDPLVESGWKVYQSGFVGDRISVFSVMHDPGLMLTYISCAALCIGIVITFYGRGLSWGHPGIPVPFSGKEQSHVAAHLRVHPVADRPMPLPGREPAGAAQAVAGAAG